MAATAVLGVQQQGRVAAPGAAERREQGLHPSAEIGNRRIRVAHRPRRAHRRAGAATHAALRLDEHVITVGAYRRRRADVDALRAADFLRPRMRADRSLVREVLRLFEFAGHRDEVDDRLRLRDGIRHPARNSPAAAGASGSTARAADRERDRTARCAQCPARAKVDRAGRTAGGDASTMRLAPVEVDLVAPVDRAFRAHLDARVAARAEIEVDRIVLRPADVERAQPSVEFRDLARVDRIGALRRQFGASRAAGYKHGDR